MSKKYTAADFANAQFAVKGNNVGARVDANDDYAWAVMQGDRHVWRTDEDMAMSGWTPATVTAPDYEIPVPDGAADAFAAYLRGKRRPGGTYAANDVQDAFRHALNTTGPRAGLLAAVTEAIDSGNYSSSGIANYLYDSGVRAHNA